MDANVSRHWFMREEVKWRTIAASVWSWFATVPVTALFVFGINVNLSRHVLIFSDFLTSLLSLKFVTVCLLCASLSAMLVFLYSHRLKVSEVVPLNRLQSLRLVSQPSNLMFMLSSMTFFTLISSILISLRCSESSIRKEQRANGEDDLIDNRLRSQHISTMSILFGCTIGLFYSLSKLLSQASSLQFFIVQEAKFLYLKGKLPHVLSECASKSAHYLYHFIIVYYFIEFIVIVTANSNNSIFSVVLSFRLRWLFDLIPVLWSLWLTGTWSLLLYNLSWNIFNAFQTQTYSFPIAPSLFSEEDDKALIKNMSDNSPLLVRYHAFHELSRIVKQNISKRKHIFSLSRGLENGRPIICNAIMKSCLNCIRKLTEDISNFQSSLLEKKDIPDDRNGEELIHSATEKNDSTSVSSSISSPRLWAQFHGTNARYRKDDYTSVPKQDLVKETSRPGSIIGTFDSTLVDGSRPREVPVQTLQNLYRDHMLVKWSLQIISYLCLKSVEEDEYGVVQAHLKDAISDMIELKKALEMVEKNAQLSSRLSKTHFSMCSDVKTAMYRISSAYGADLTSLGFNSEQLQLVYRFVNADE